MPKKYCFMNKERVCDLTCKAAFEVDDPVDNVDCYFIWLAYHFGEGLYEVRRTLEAGMGMAGMGSGDGPGPGPFGPGGASGPGGSGGGPSSGGPPSSPGPKPPKGGPAMN